MCVRKLFYALWLLYIWTGTRACLQKRHGGRVFSQEVDELTIGFLPYYSHLRIRLWSKGGSIVDWGPFQKHLLSWPSFLLIHSRENPRTSSPLVHMLGPALPIRQSGNERHIYLDSEMSLFHETLQFKWQLTKNNADEFKSLSSWTKPPREFCSISLNSIFKSNIIVSHNFVRNTFALYLLFDFCLFLYISEWTHKRRRGLDNYCSDKTWKAQWTSKANYSVLLASSPSLKQKVMKRWETLNFCVN